MKKIICALAVLALALLFALPAFAAPPLLTDEAGLLSAAEAAALEEKLQALSDRWDMDVAVVTAASTQGATPMEFADDWFDYNGYGRGENYDGLLLLIHTDKDPPGGWISTCGRAVGVFTDAGIQFIGKQIKADGLDEGDTAAALDSFADWCEKFFAQAETGKPFDEGSLPKTSGDYARIALLGLLGGLGIAWVVTKRMQNSLKTVRKNNQAADYVRPGSLRVVYANERFLYKNVTRVKRETSSGGGGGSSTHTSSSGRTHGGGGF
ncbi:MAG: TPM domain-containing protein [Firmicutes bacterium]|nr:TPM domain-containing protein [Bacillota bacterium]